MKNGIYMAYIQRFPLKRIYDQAEATAGEKIAAELKRLYEEDRVVFIGEPEAYYSALRLLLDDYWQRERRWTVARQDDAVALRYLLARYFGTTNGLATAMRIPVEKAQFYLAGGPGLAREEIRAVLAVTKEGADLFV